MQRGETHRQNTTRPARCGGKPGNAEDGQKLRRGKKGFSPEPQRTWPHDTLTLIKSSGRVHSVTFSHLVRGALSQQPQGMTTLKQTTWDFCPCGPPDRHCKGGHFLGTSPSTLLPGSEFVHSSPGPRAPLLPGFTPLCLPRPSRHQHTVPSSGLSSGCTLHILPPTPVPPSLSSVERLRAGRLVSGPGCAISEHLAVRPRASSHHNVSISSPVGWEY